MQLPGSAIGRLNPSLTLKRAWASNACLRSRRLDAGSVEQACLGNLEQRWTPSSFLNAPRPVPTKQALANFSNVAWALWLRAKSCSLQLPGSAIGRLNPSLTLRRAWASNACLRSRRLDAGSVEQAGLGNLERSFGCDDFICTLAVCRDLTQTVRCPVHAVIARTLRIGTRV